MTHPRHLRALPSELRPRKADNKESAGNGNDDETEEVLIAQDNASQQISDTARTAACLAVRCLVSYVPYLL